MDLQLFERKIWACPSENYSWRSSQAVRGVIRALDVDSLRATGASESSRPGRRRKFSAAEFGADGAEYREYSFEQVQSLLRRCGDVSPLPLVGIEEWRILQECSESAASMILAN